jgi:hypothetical protein
MTEIPRNGNYRALAELFFTGDCTVPDGIGELIPCAEEAAAIRQCGFNARPGRIFRCPPSRMNSSVVVGYWATSPMPSIPRLASRCGTRSEPPPSEPPISIR